MRIWLAAAIDKKEFGGVARCLREIGAGLGQSGHCVTIIAAPGFKGSGNYLGFALYLLARFIGAAARPPDCIIARSSDAVFCALYARCFGKKTKIILHNHGWEEKVYALEQRLPAAIVAHPSTWKARLLRFPLLRLTLSLCSVCVSGAMDEVRWLKNRYARGSARLRLIPNGVGVLSSPFWPQQQAWPLAFLAIGGNTWKKNITYTIALFYLLEQMLPESRFVIIGAAENSVPQAAPLCARGRLTLLPNCSFTETESWYRRCPFLISSSRYEGGRSFVLLEAMAQGCVVFASDIAASSEIIRHGRNGFLLSGIHSETDAQAIVNSVKNQERLRLIGLNAFATARRNRWERQIARWERVICNP